MERLDDRYRTKYGMSTIDNLRMIEKYGIRKFIETEKNKWIKGNKIFCVHTKRYYAIKKI